MISLILGLGNVGEVYADTRHNTGFMALDEAASLVKAKSPRQLTHCRVSTATVEGREITLAWPDTLMNRSGLAAEYLLSDLDLKPEDMLVVTDDLNLPLGTIRFRAGGSDGGHNGLLSLIDVLETEAFPRLRLGIGPPPDRDSLTEFVLGQFSAGEADQVKRMVAIAAEAVIFAVCHRLQEAMSEYNSNPALPE
ncbi:MAG: aminoacyl-tRNA hydrolase [bacterium]|nr:aminoacyl-tRNA hydrolase [bacterium]